MQFLLYLVWLFSFTGFIWAIQVQHMTAHKQPNLWASMPVIH